MGRILDRLLPAATLLTVLASGLAACVNGLLVAAGRPAATVLVAISAAGGVAASGMAFAWYRQRKAVAQERVQMVAALNHEIRNAVQVISLASYTDCGACKGAIQDSVVRIKAALNEHVPNEVSRGEIANFPLPTDLSSKAR